MRCAESPAVLEGGSWVQRGMIRIWEPAPPAPAVLRTPSYAPHDLIACPTCHARMDEFCTRPGSKRHSHDARLVKRVCSCGGPVRTREPICGLCRAELATAGKEAA